MTFDAAIEQAQSEASPSELSKTRVWLAGRYAYLNGLVTEILKKKPFVWDKIRNSEGVGSDTQADRKWQMTEDGQNEIQYLRELKSCEKLMSAISSRIKIAEGEAHGQY